MKPENFWAKVERGEPGSCWIWRGAMSRGYGAFRVDKFIRKAHHVALFLTTGEWPAENRQICHRCHVPLCVNPAHLYEGSVLDNGADKAKRGAERPPRVSRIRIDIGAEDPRLTERAEPADV